MDALRPYVYGQCLAGAGGGGFLYVLTKVPRQKEALHQILAKTEVRYELLGGSLSQVASRCSLYIAPALEASRPTTSGMRLLVPLAFPRTLEVRTGPLLAPAPTCNWFFLLVGCFGFFLFSRDWATSASTASQWTPAVSLWRFWDVI